MYRDDLGSLALVIKCFGITNISYKISLFEFPLFKLYRKLKFNVDVSSL